jgi:hypothetical protein
MLPAQRNYLLTRVDLDIGQKDPKKAILTLRQIVAAYPNDAESSFRLAKLLATNDDVDGAKKLLARVVSFAPWHLGARDYLATIERQVAPTTEKPKPPVIGTFPRWFIASFAFGLAIFFALYAMVETHGQGDDPTEKTVITCDVPAAAEDPTPTPTPSPTPTTPASVLPWTGASDTREAATRHGLVLQEATVTPPAIATPQRFVGGTCTPEIATKVEVTQDSGAGGLSEIPTSYLGVIAALGFVAILFALLPLIRTIAFGNAKLELTGADDTSKQQPVPPVG